MINISSLDTIIAVVLVILVLSLVVQAAQNALKKAFDIKSRQIQDSLIDLFESVVPNVTRPDLRGVWVRITASSPILRLLHRGQHPADPTAHPDPRVRELLAAVTQRAKAIGRTNITGKLSLESLPKSDLLNAVRRVPIGNLFPGLADKLQQAYQIANAAEAAVTSIQRDLAGTLSTSFTCLREKLAPLFNNLEALAAGGAIQTGSLTGDVANLRDINWDAIFAALSDVQQEIRSEIAQAKMANQPVQVTALTGLDAGLNDLASKLAELRRKLSVALAPISAKITEIENAYDSVRQSLQERYFRSMRTWAMVISFIVVVVLNASFFNVYTDIATSDAKRNLVLQSREEIEKLYNQTNPALGSGQSQGKGSPQDQTAVQEWFKAAQREIDNNSSIYTGFGFTPLGWSQSKAWWLGLKTTSKGWGARRIHDLKVLLGWIIMALLLSVGAPFWEDALESLLGVKNVLRQRAGGST